MVAPPDRGGFDAESGVYRTGGETVFADQNRGVKCCHWFCPFDGLIATKSPHLDSETIPC